MIIVLDTNVVSESILRAGEPRVAHWMDHQAQSDLYLTVITAAELAYGVIRLPAGRRRVELEAEVNCQIAGICLAQGATLATRNVKDFEGCGVQLVNPWE